MFRRRIPWQYPAAALICVVALLLDGCSTPRHDGPNISHPPEGFIYDANSTQSRNIFADEDILHQSAWVRQSGDDHCSITMTEYTGSASRKDTQEALDYFIKKYSYLEYGPLEAVTVDGREAWGWLETQYYKGELSSLEYKVIVSYEDCCWAIEFFAGEPAYHNKAFIKETVCGFRRGK